MRNVYLDCEFNRGDLSPSGLISIGITSEGHSYYAVNSGMKTAEIRASEWMMENVWPHIPSTRRFILDRSHKDVKDYDTIKAEVSDFFESMAVVGDSNYDVRLIAWCGGQDLVRLHGLWNHDWSVMPPWIPRYLHDIQEDIVNSGIDESDLPEQDPQTKHHALFDAEHDEILHRFLEEARGS